MSIEALVRPIISEKSLKEADRGNYTFEVSHASNKESIRKAFKEAFGVDVTKVRTLILKGKTSRVWGRRDRARVSPLKKAIVSLKKGQKLDVFEVKAS